MGRQPHSDLSRRVHLAEQRRCHAETAFEGLAEARILPILQVAQARFEEEQRLRAQVSAAEARLAERKTIERAKGILMKSRGFSEAEAYNVLRSKAMQTNCKLAEVAQRIIDMADLLG